MVLRRFRERKAVGSVVGKKYRPRVEAVEARLLLSALTVTTTDDDGAGSLRQAIIDSNASTDPSMITFSIGSGGPQTFVPKSPLPPITNPVTIDATTEPGFAGTPIVAINGSQIFFQKPPVPPSTTPTPTTTPIPGVDGLHIQAGSTKVKGLAISRFTGNGIAIIGNGRNVITGNYLGTDLTGLLALGNGQDGVFKSDSRNNIIGGTTPGEGNLISGNGASGVEIVSSPQSLTGGNVVEGNLIGTDATATGDLDNTYDGVTINASTRNTIGGLTTGIGNTIAFNGGDGVKVGIFSFFSGSFLNNAILSNSIDANGGLGINLGFGANNTVSSGALTSAYPSGTGTGIEGSYFGLPTSRYNIQHFSNPNPDPSGAGEGRTLIGSIQVTTNSDGLGRIADTLPVSVDVAQSISATATDQNNNTSAFFRNASVAPMATADLAVFQSVIPAQVKAGGTLVYTVTVHNNGPSNAQGVVLTDTLPPGLTVTTVQTCAGTFSQDNGVVRVDLGEIPQGESEIVTIRLTTTTGGKVENMVSVTSDQTDPDLKNNSSTIGTQVATNPSPLLIVGGRLLTGLRSINGIILNFNQALDPSQATNPINYSLMELGPKFMFTVPVPLNTPVYNPTSLTVTLTPTKPLAIGKLYQLQVDGPGSAGLTDPSGKLLVGNTQAGFLGPWLWQISRGYLTAPVAHTPPRVPNGHHDRLPRVKLIESVTTRRVLTGPAMRTANGTLVNNLPRLVETTTGPTNTLNTR